MNTWKRFFSLFILAHLLSACNPLKAESIPSPVIIQEPVSTSTEIPEESLIATEQAMAGTAHAEFALTLAAQPTFTPQPTLTSVLAHLPTLTPIPNSTPAQVGAFFDVPPNVLGARYEIENACYFDTQSGRERYEVYAGAIAGSGDEYSAQGVVVVRILQVVEKDSEPFVEIADTREYLTLSKEGSLHIPVWNDCGDNWMYLRTPLEFMWVLNPISEEFYQDFHNPPLAKLEINGKTQLAKLKGDSPVFSTNAAPLIGQFPFTAQLRLPLEIPPDRLTLAAMLVSPPGTLIYDNAYDNATRESVGWWSDGQLRNPPIKREILNLGSLPLLHDQKINLSLEPGFYVLVVNALWFDVDGYGHLGVEYNFLIEVQ